MEKINIAELLKDCPKGMELDCTIYNGKVCFEEIDDRNPAHTIIKISVNLVHIERLDAWGQYSTRDYSKCVIFPKGKTTWEGFVPPCRFKAGDVLVSENGNIVLLSHIDSKNVVHYHCIIPTYGSFRIEENTSTGVGRYYDCVLANEQQRQRMYDKLKYSGYEYNQQLNKLEKLTEPKFKAGDRIRSKNIKDECFYILNVDKDRYKYILNIKGYCLEFKDQNNYELVPNKFDITTLIPFESRVLVRNSCDGFWMPTFWGIYEAEKANRHLYRNYLTTKGFFCQCIPYNDNTKHLLGTTDDCDEFYKTWE